MTSREDGADTQLTTKAFSDRSGIPMATVQKWLRSGKLTGTKIGNRWYISPAELTRIEDASPSPPPADHPPEGLKDAERFSVAEFSALTYLTEVGVQRWLRAGRLEGHVAEDGSCWVSAGSLRLPHMRHLIR